MLALRASGLAELIVATAAIVATARPAAAPQHPFAMPELPQIRVAHVATAAEPCWQLPPEAAQAYAAHDFATAGARLTVECFDAEGQLLRELDRLWRATATGDVAARYHALIDALAIDTTFGGRLADEIEREERAIVAEVALQLVAQHRDDEAETVIAHGKLLGVDMRVPEQRLARAWR